MTLLAERHDRPRALAQVGRAFAEPVHGAQGVFRAVLEAMSRPGTVQRLPALALHGLEPPHISPALCAVLLSLLDAETSVHLDLGGADGAVADYLRLHTGVVLAADTAGAAFAALAAERASAALWRSLHPGTDEAPQAGCTLVLDVPALAAAATPGVPSLVLRGPGIRDTHRFAVHGVDAAFWQARIAAQTDYPRGVDLILTCGSSVAALPRTTRISFGA